MATDTNEKERNNPFSIYSTHPIQISTSPIVAIPFIIYVKESQHIKPNKAKRSQKLTTV